MSQPNAHILALIPAWNGADAVITPLEGGITNQNYRVALGNEHFVLRVGGQNTHLLGIDREREHTCTALAARLGIGAEVVSFHTTAQAQVLVTRFIPGTQLTAERASSPLILPRIVASITRYHNGPAFPGTFSPFETVRSYYQSASARAGALPATLPQALHLMAQIEEACGPRQQRRPCHNDLLAANFIDDGQQIRIVDWEYAGMGDPFFDLGNFAANQALDDDRCEQLVRLYTGCASPADLAHLHLMRLASDLRESLWGLLQVSISDLAFDYRDYAQHHLQRFLQGAQAPRFAHWLQAMHA